MKVNENEEKKILSKETGKQIGILEKYIKKYIR